MASSNRKTRASESKKGSDHSHAWTPKVLTLARQKDALALDIIHGAQHELARPY